MKYERSWSHAPYRPSFFEVGEPYICRVAPTKDSIALEWLGDGECAIFCRRRGEGDFREVGHSSGGAFTIDGLTDGAEYEFYVEGALGRSRVRLARCGEVFDGGTVVNYLHPEDEAYSFSGKYLCSPSLLRCPDGSLLASMDLFAGNYPQNLTLVYRSCDGGKSWHYQCELFPCFWGKLFLYRGEVYMLAVSTEYGDLLIGRSSDLGRSFSEPVVLLRGSGGKNGEAGIHKNPQPVVEFGGRLWFTLEFGSWGRGYHAPMVASAPIGSDICDPESWSFSEPVKYDSGWHGVPRGESTGNIEGCLVELDGKLYNLMRYDMTRLERKYGLIVAYIVNTDEPEKPLEYRRVIEFPANHSKFTIKYDARTEKYYSLASRITDSEHIHARNLLSLMSSRDCIEWTLERDLLDYRNEDPAMIGFQYVDFIIEGDEISYLCRTAMNGAHNFHDANYSIFGRISLGV